LPKVTRKKRKAKFSKKLFRFFNSKPVRVALIIAGVLLIFFGRDIYNNAVAEQEKILDPVTGELKPYYELDPNQPVYVELGGVSSNFSVKELAEGFDLTRLIHIEQGNQTVTFPIQIALSEKTNNIIVSAKIFDEKGTLLANIINNEWQAPSSGGMDIWDKNYNSYAFEVIDSNKLPILQVIMGGKNEILIGCSLYHQGVPLFATLTHGFNFFGSGNITPEQLQELRNARIFEYPSKEHLGELKAIPDFFDNPKTYPTDNPLAESSFNKIKGAVLEVTGMIIGAFVTVETLRNRKT